MFDARISGPRYDRMLSGADRADAADHHIVAQHSAVDAVG